MVAIDVNGRPVEARNGETVLTALLRAGEHIPTLCDIPGLCASGACRICLVEIEGQDELIPSCAVPVCEGMKIWTHSEGAVRARKTIVELLLANHPDDCLYCIRNGNCRLQHLAAELGVRKRRFAGLRSHRPVDSSSPALMRDPEKCILCGKCVRVCEEWQSVGAVDFTARGSRTKVAAAFDKELNESSCVCCGQCILVCPTGALRERSHAKAVMDALRDPSVFVVVQHAPAVAVALAEEFGMKPGADVNGALVTALRRLGFDRVFDASFAADLTVMEQAAELVQCIKNRRRLPLFTSCSPGWVKFVEQFYPELLPNLSTCKSSQQMLGAVAKSYFAQQAGVDPKNIFSVSIVPCIAKKFEARRPEMAHGGLADVDAVLTTREFSRLLRMRGIDLAALPGDSADTPLGERASVSKPAAAGGLMEAALRTASYLLKDEDLRDLELEPVRGVEGVREGRVILNGSTLGVAVVRGLGNARRLLDQLKAGRDDLHFVEVLTCPAGCLGGGGQLLTIGQGALRARLRTLRRIDRDRDSGLSHRNPCVRQFYEKFLGQPLGRKSRELLHTAYHPRDAVM